MKARMYRILAVFLDVSVLVLSTLMYQRSTQSDLPSYGMQMLLLSAFSTVFSVAFLWRGLVRRFPVALSFLRTLAFALMTICVPLIDLRFLPLTISYALMLTLHVPVRLFLVMIGLWLALISVVFIAFPNANIQRSLWGYELQLYVLLTAGAVICSIGLRNVVSELTRATERNQVLSDEVNRLADANLGFQQFASLLEQESTRSERLRLSREIHDSAGYALTTLKMIFEVAKVTAAQNPEKLDPLIDQGARLSQDALQDVRSVLHELRDHEERLPDGMRLVALLAKNFENACGIRVFLELTNTKSSYGRKVDAAVYRMVQEGMTNAFRHGRADEVTIILSESEGNLAIRIRDNGTGAAATASVTKGIGLSGMEERLADAGGWMHYRSQEDGFEIEAFIPVKGGS